MAPYLAFGLFIAGVLHVVVNRAVILKQFGKRGIGSVVRAAVLGVPLPLCSCSVVPTALSLKKHGASNGATVSFLISTPQTGVESIAATAGMMGPFFALFRPFVALITGIIGGSIVNFFPDNSVEISDNSVNAKPKWNFITAIIGIFRYGFGELMDDIGPNLLVGIIISALITVLIPDSFFTQYIGNSFLEMVIVMIGSVPLYVCATASIPIAAALMMKGVSAGAAFVFLMAGPATNAATISVIYSKLGKRIGTIYLTVIVVSSLVFGLVLNWGYTYFAIDPMASMNHHIHGENGQSIWMIFVATLFTIPLIWSLWKTKIKVPLFRLLKRSKSSDTSIVSIYKIGGLTCSKCSAKVTDLVSMLEGVVSADVDLELMELTVLGDVSKEYIEQVVTNCGYQFDRLLRATHLVRTFSVTGMSCKNCVNHVTQAIELDALCTDVEVSLENQIVTCTGVVSDEIICDSVKKIGYGIERIE